MPTKDLAKRKMYNSASYYRHVDERKYKIKKRKEEISRWFRDYKKALSCTSCGEADSSCIDFHHINPKEKDTPLWRVTQLRSWSKERIITEVAKCLVLCSNCHRKLHAGRLQAASLIGKATDS